MRNLLGCGVVLALMVGCGPSLSKQELGTVVLELPSGGDDACAAGAHEGCNCSHASDSSKPKKGSAAQDSDDDADQKDEMGAPKEESAKTDGAADPGGSAKPSPQPSADNAPATN